MDADWLSLLAQLTIHCREQALRSSASGDEEENEGTADRGSVTSSAAMRQDWHTCGQQSKDILLVLVEARLMHGTEPQWAQLAVEGLIGDAGRDPDGSARSLRMETVVEVVEQLLGHLSQASKLRGEDKQRHILRANVLSVLEIAAAKIEPAYHARVLSNAGPALEFARRILPLGGSHCWAVFRMTRGALEAGARAVRQATSPDEREEAEGVLTTLVLLVQSFMVLELQPLSQLEADHIEAKQAAAGGSPSKPGAAAAAAAAGKGKAATPIRPQPKITGLGSSGDTVAKDGGISDSTTAAAEAAAARARGSGGALSRRAGPGVSRVALVQPASSWGLGSSEEQREALFFLLEGIRLAFDKEAGSTIEEGAEQPCPARAEAMCSVAPQATQLAAAVVTAAFDTMAAGMCLGEGIREAIESGASQGGQAAPLRQTPWDDAFSPARSLWTKARAVLAAVQTASGGNGPASPVPSGSDTDAALAAAGAHRRRSRVMQVADDVLAS